MPLLPLVSAWGAVYLFKKLKKGRQIFLLAVLAVSFCSWIYLSEYYFQVYPTQTGSIWQSGYKQLYSYFSQKEGKEGLEEEIRISKFYGEPHIFYLFYSQYLPSKYQSGEGVVRYDREDQWINVDQIGNFYFFDQPDWEKPGTVVLSVFESQPKDKQPAIKIYFPNGEPAFVIYEIENEK